MNKNRLLTDEKIGDLLDLEKEFTYPCSDGSKTTTVDCHAVVKAQRDLTASIKDAECQRKLKLAEKYCRQLVADTNAQRAIECQQRVERLIKEIHTDLIDTIRVNPDWLDWQALKKKEGIGENQR